MKYLILLLLIPFSSFAMQNPETYKRNILNHSRDSENDNTLSVLLKPEIKQDRRIDTLDERMARYNVRMQKNQICLGGISTLLCGCCALLVYLAKTNMCKCPH